MSSDPLAFKVFNEIGIIDQLTTHAFDEVLPARMTSAQFGILNHFLRLGHDARTPAELASAFQVTRPTMTTTLARMEKAGLVAIGPHPEDGRSKLVRITDAGRAMREDCVARLEQPLADLHAHVPTELLEQLDPLLTQLRTILDGMRN